MKKLFGLVFKVFAILLLALTLLFGGFMLLGDDSEEIETTTVKPMETVEYSDLNEEPFKTEIISEYAYENGEHFRVDYEYKFDRYGNFVDFELKDIVVLDEAGEEERVLDYEEYMNEYYGGF